MLRTVLKLSRASGLAALVSVTPSLKTSCTVRAARRSTLTLVQHGGVWQVQASAMIQSSSKLSAFQ